MRQITQAPPTQDTSSLLPRRGARQRNGPSLAPGRGVALFALPALALFLLASGCFRVTTVNIGQKTALERQLIGEFEPLTEEELLAASVRAGNEMGAGSLDALQQKAIAARRRQLFNRDDVDELMALGCLGEATGALLAARECEATQAEEVEALRTRIIKQENEDRRAIIDWALAADPVLAASDRPELTRLYGRLLREKAASGTWVQLEGGTWEQMP